MMTLMILSTLVGGVLAMRFKVFVLSPAMLLSVALNVGIASAQASSLWETLPAIVLSFTGLQLGFVVSCVMLQTVPHLLGLNSDIVKAESLIEQQDGDLEAACKQLDGIVPELMALSAQMAVQPAEAEVKARAEDRPAVDAFARSKAS
jgi:hypothetical protein